VVFFLTGICVQFLVEDRLLLLPLPTSHFFIEYKGRFVGQLVGLLDFILPSLLFGHVFQSAALSRFQRLRVILDFFGGRCPEKVYSTSACGRSHTLVLSF